MYSDSVKSLEQGWHLSF
jgi:hypothetical protein